MKAFPNLLITRALMIADMVAHRKADRLIAGSYGDIENGDFKGCAVGCSIYTINQVLGTQHSFRDHDALAKIIGVPVDLMSLQDRIFEGLPAKDRVLWPERFYRAIPEGSDQSDTPRRISIRFLREIILPVITTDDWGCRKAIIETALAVEIGDAEKIKAVYKAAMKASGAARAARSLHYAAACLSAAFLYDVGSVYVIYAVDATTNTGVWRQIADIVCEEMTRAPQNLEQNQ